MANENVEVRLLYLRMCLQKSQQDQELRKELKSWAKGNSSLDIFDSLQLVMFMA
jgi:hypothetical protein